MLACSRQPDKSETRVTVRGSIRENRATTGVYFEKPSFDGLIDWRQEPNREDPLRKVESLDV